MVYLDNNATTKPNLQMLNAAAEVITNSYGNPSAAHAMAHESRAVIEEARANVAELLGVNSSNVIFTSGGTESNNLALFGLGPQCPAIVSAVEHSSVFKADKLFTLSVNSDGTLNERYLEQTLRSITSPCIVSVMLANNETGVILDPNNKLLELKRQLGTFLLHVDAVQGFGKILDYTIPDEVDLLSISGHKIHGLKGVGALYVRDGLELTTPNRVGGSHEFGLRPGTENQIGIYSLGYMSYKIKHDEFYRQRITHVGYLRDLLEQRLSDISKVNGNLEHRVNNVSNLYFPAVTDVELFIELLSEENVYVSGGAACSSGIPGESRVLTAMYGADDPRTRGSIRISWSVDNTEGDVLEAEQGIRSALTQYMEIENDG